MTDTTPGAAQESSDERRKMRAFRDALATMVREHGLSIFSDEVIQQVEALLPDDVCRECWAVPEPHDGPGAPIRQPGRLHHGWCPTIPHLSPEQRESLNARLAELSRARRRAMSDAHNYVVGGKTSEGEPTS